jgi:hypothetical protein
MLAFVVEFFEMILMFGEMFVLDLSCDIALKLDLIRALYPFSVHSNISSTQDEIHA